jgi:hypothetical protein
MMNYFRMLSEGMEKKPTEKVSRSLEMSVVAEVNDEDPCVEVPLVRCETRPRRGGVSSAVCSFNLILLIFD